MEVSFTKDGGNTFHHTITTEVSKTYFEFVYPIKNVYNFQV